MLKEVKMDYPLVSIPLHTYELLMNDLEGTQEVLREMLDAAQAAGSLNSQELLEANLSSLTGHINSLKDAIHGKAKVIA